MITIEELLQQAIALDASDIFIIAGHACAFKVNGKIISTSEDKLMPADSAYLIKEIYGYVLQNKYETFLEKKDDYNFIECDKGQIKDYIKRIIIKGKEKGFT
ncbi:MAG: hypothetical protein RR766_08085, partial [Longicatena sp.]